MSSGQGSVAGGIQVYIRTYPFKPDDPQYSQGITVPLMEPTDDTMRLTRAALSGLAKIYRRGYAYAKARGALSVFTTMDPFCFRHKGASGFSA